MKPRRLRDCANFVRSKNAGPFTVTIDIFFDSRATLDAAWACEALSERNVADIYGVQEIAVRRFRIDQATALKISLPRPVPAGELGDTDVAGGQQFLPLLDVELE